MYRPQIKVLDCTIRDGGLINKWQFSDKTVRKVFLALSMSGIDYMEIGYKSSEKYFSRAEHGAWKFCTEEDIKRIVGEVDTKMKLSAMADIGRIDSEDIPNKKDSILDMIRVACSGCQKHPSIINHRKEISLYKTQGIYRQFPFLYQDRVIWTSLQYQTITSGLMREKPRL